MALDEGALAQAAADLGVSVEELDEVQQELAMAFAESLLEEAIEKNRAYDFRVSQPVPVHDIERYLRVIGSYNDFDPEGVSQALREGFPEDTKVWPGMEARSPVLYIKGLPDPNTLISLARRTAADETSVENGVIRLWWD